MLAPTSRLWTPVKVPFKVIRKACADNHQREVILLILSAHSEALVEASASFCLLLHRMWLPAVQNSPARHVRYVWSWAIRPTGPRLTFQNVSLPTWSVTQHAHSIVLSIFLHWLPLALPRWTITQPKAANPPLFRKTQRPAIRYVADFRGEVTATLRKPSTSDWTPQKLSGEANAS